MEIIKTGKTGTIITACGDVITDGTYTRKVLAVCGELVGLSFTKANGVGWDVGFDCWAHQEGLKGYHLISDDTKEKEAIEFLEKRGRLKDGKVIVK